MKNGELKIETGIPIPKGRNHGMTEALRKLKVGESVLLPVSYTPTGTTRNAGLAFKTVMRKVEGGYRVWRIK